MNDRLRQAGGNATHVDATDVDAMGHPFTPATIWQCPAGFTTG